MNDIVTNLHDDLEGYYNPAMVEPQLCFVRSPWAFFTTKAPSEQSGSHWHRDVRNDARSLFGEPYSPREAKDFHRGIPTAPHWLIAKLAFDGPLVDAFTRLNDPCLEGDADHAHYVNVRDVNRQIAPWLSSYTTGIDDPDEEPVKLYAGALIPEFFEIVESAGGHVYTYMPFAAVRAARGW